MLQGGQIRKITDTCFTPITVAEHRGRSVEDILLEAAGLRARLIGVMERFSDDKLDSTIRFGGDRKRPPVDLPLGQFLGGWGRHDAIHVADMLKALPERRNDPEILAWLGRPDVAASISSYRKAMGQSPQLRRLAVILPRFGPETNDEVTFS